MPALQKEIESTIAKATGSPIRISGGQSIGGGCIHNARCLTGKDGRQFFVKENRHALLPSFEAEAHSLDVMAKTETIRVPKPVGVCTDNSSAALILEYLPMGGRGKGDWRRMGAELARLHEHMNPAFGWDHDNWIGSTPQINSWRDDWITFYGECRLLPQIRWARDRGLRLREAESLIDRLPEFFQSYRPAASLLHGDLWAGNASFLTDGTPVIFDPASYYGDRESDLAMTELFGGFPEAFYAGYESVLPIDPEYSLRRDLYQLYHVLNHFNLFGGGYGSQAEGMVRRLIAAV